VIGMSPRTARQNEQIREDRRRELLQAAVPLFARGGFDGTSTAAVAKAAGISHGALFLYFPTKEALFRAAVTEPLAPSLELVQQVLGAPGSPRERVETLARVMLTSFAQEEAYLRLVQYVARLRDRFPEVAADLLQFTAGTVAVLSAVIAEGQAAGQFTAGDPVHLAHLFYALIQGCGLMHPAPPEDPFWADATAAALRLLTHS
jgi:AcrR family transcriptional regulator